MSESINSLKDKALQILITESFRYINQQTHHGHVELARKNAKLRSVTANYFTYNGYIYPNTTSTGESVRLTNVIAPSLHYSLYEEFDGLTKQMEKAGSVEISNYFRAVLSYSVNGIVLDELLPGILVSHLRGDFTVEEFSLINDGLSDVKSRWEPIEVTRQNILDIKNHYANTISLLRSMLMDKLLMASG